MSDHEPLFVADADTQLRAKLDEVRAELVETLDGLTEEQARRRLVPRWEHPSRPPLHRSSLRHLRRSPSPDRPPAGGRR